MIPDSTAYRLLFVSLAEGANPAPEEVSRHKGLLASAQLRDTDAQSVADALRTFKTQYEELIKNYNDLADIAIQKGEGPDYNAFLIQREALVQATRDKLTLALSGQGVAKLDAFVQGEKTKMKTQPAQ